MKIISYMILITIAILFSVTLPKGVFADPTIKFSDTSEPEVKLAPLQILCMGGLDAPEAAHVLYNCEIEEFKTGDSPDPVACKPAMPGLPPFKLGERLARCPIDGSAGSAHQPPSDWKNRTDGKLGILGKDMVVYTNKGWMPCEPKNFEKKWKC